MPILCAPSLSPRESILSVSSYGSGVKTSGVVKIIKDLDHPLAGYDLLLVEDIRQRHDA